MVVLFTSNWLYNYTLYCVTQKYGGLFVSYVHVYIDHGELVHVFVSGVCSI